MTLTLRPENYPHGQASEIFDAGSFRVTDSENGGKCHIVKSFPEWDTVTARCGLVAKTIDAYENGRAAWASVMLPNDFICPTCAR